MRTVVDTPSRSVEESIGIVDDGMGHSASGTYRFSFTMDIVQQPPFPMYAGSGVAYFVWNPGEIPTSTSPVPDGGTTAILLGSAFAGLTLIRRKLA